MPRYIATLHVDISLGRLRARSAARPDRLLHGLASHELLDYVLEYALADLKKVENY